MSKWIHRLSNIDPVAKTGLCSHCGPVRLKIREKFENRINWRCYTAFVKDRRNRQSPWRIFKKTSCEKCGFIPQHSSQLDVDHIDGNKKNNDPSNLQTLCANCHRLKTHLNRDWENEQNKKRPVP